MSTFKQKNVIKSYKLRLQEKLKTITDETENATSFLNSCVEEFRKRVQHILEIKDGKCLSLYKKLNQDLESYSEKLFILQASFEGTEDESDSSEDEKHAVEMPATHPKTTPKYSSTSLSFENEDSSKMLSCSEDYVNLQKQETGDKQRYTDIVNLQNHKNEEQKYAENVNLQFYPEENIVVQKYPANNSSDQKFQEEIVKYNSQIEDDNITDDDFYSLNSDNVQNMNSCTTFSSQSHECHEGNECTSSVSISQSSYRSLSSNISEPLAFHKENKSNNFVETSILEIKDNCSPETSYAKLVIQPPNIEVLSNFSGTLSSIIDPGNFWIQLENSHGYKLSFPKSEYNHFESLTSIEKGSYCLAPFKLKPFYYRAQSLSNSKSGNEYVKVLFIDHGSTQEISVCDLRPLPESAYKVSAQAIHCYLHGIVPVKGSWSHDSIKRFKDFQRLDSSIDGVVKSKAALYGVHLVVNISADLDEDYSIDIGQALFLDGFAELLNESQSSEYNQQYESQLSYPSCNKIDSFQDSCDINAISNDSGVSVTSAFKSSQISFQRNENFQKGSEDCITSITAKHEENTKDLKPNVQIKDLILFDSYDTLNGFQNSTEVLKPANSFSCHLCSDENFCLHFKVPSPSLLFVEKDMVIVMLSHIVNPHEFYVNMAMKNIDTLDDLREQMTSTYKSQKNLYKVKINDLEENMFCAGRFNDDDYWYRVKIIRISPDDKKKDQVLCQYIDYGNVVVIHCSDLRLLKVDFSKHPSFAIKCTLAGVTPVKDVRSGDHSFYWKEDAINCFKNLTPFERCLTAQICSELSNNQKDIFSVLLWDTKDSRDLLINAQLAEHGVAVFDYSLLNSTLTNQKEVQKSQNDLDSWDPMVEEYFDPDNNYTLDDENIQVMTTGYQARDEDYTCKYFAIHGNCPRGANCNYKHLPLLESGVTHDQEEVYCLNTVPISETVNNILVKISAIITPNHFYVVLPFGCKSVDDIDNLVYKGSSYAEITNSDAKVLFDAINKHYSNAPFNENTKIALSCGSIVAAKREWDGKWHRGRIVDVAGINQPSKVFFVDSGDHEWVPRKFIRTILLKFLHTPFQAVQCNLYDIEFVGSEKELSWSSEAINYFKDIVDGEPLLAKIVHRFGQVLHVSLRKTSQNDHATVAELLVSAGFAQYLKVVQSDKNQTVYVPG